MTQEIKTIDIADLVLWTENPRDQIDANATDQDIANIAWENKNEKWSLKNLAKEMQPHYDFSELPTVVYHKNKPIVYDANRRIILAKIKHNLITLEDFDKEILPEIPQKIPCNVCTKDIAVKNVFRKHGDSGSWSHLDRDIFIYKHMGGSKSIFLKFDESTNFISSNPHLNKRFVKEEIFSEEKLKVLGFTFENEEFLSNHSKEDSLSILNDISAKVAYKRISTRNNRGQVYDVLEKENRLLIEKNIGNEPKKITLNTSLKSTKDPKRKAARTKKKELEFFGSDLYLTPGKVSDFYRDITDLYKFYCKRKNYLSQYFPSLIRMSLRLLCESAAAENGD